MKVSQRASSVAGSATLTLATRAKEMAASGLDVVSMAVGEPDFSTPELVREAVRTSVTKGRVRYTPAAGTTSLRAALASTAGSSRGIELTPSQVVVTHSCKHALNLVLAAVVEPGDEVLLLEPVWGSYDAAVSWSGARAVRVASRPDLGPDLEAIAAAARTAKGVMLNSPTNPSGYVWTDEELRGLLAIAEEHDLWIISDEIYRRLSYGDKQATSPLSLGESARERILAVDGASKSLAMTGFRIGCVFGPEAVVKAIANVQSETTGCPNALSQAGWEAALLEEPPEVDGWVSSFKARRDLLINGLRDLGMECAMPGGAFYAFPSVAPFLDERGSAGFCDDLLESEQLVIVPGTVFGMDDHVRLSYALGEPQLQDALQRLGRFLDGRRAQG